MSFVHLVALVNLFAILGRFALSSLRFGRMRFVFVTDKFVNLILHFVIVANLPPGSVLR